MFNQSLVEFLKRNHACRESLEWLNKSRDLAQAISGTLSGLGMIKLSTGQQFGAAVCFLVCVVIAHRRAS